MRGRERATEQVVGWIQEQVRTGRLRLGDAFPSERELSDRLKVGRGAIREAKASLAGRGLVVQEGWRSVIARPDGAALFRDWIAEATNARGRHGVLSMREALDLWFLLLPEILALAVLRASEPQLLDIAERLEELRFGIIYRESSGQLFRYHDRLLCFAAEVTRNSALFALATGLAESLVRLPLWEGEGPERTAWEKALNQVLELTRARRFSDLRPLLRNHLLSLEPRISNMVKAFRLSPGHEDPP